MEGSILLRLVIWHVLFCIAERATLYFLVCGLRCENIQPVIPGVYSQLYLSTHLKAGHHRPASEPPFGWKFTGGTIVARHCVLAGMCITLHALNAVLRMHICAGSSEPLSHVISNKIT